MIADTARTIPRWGWAAIALGLVALVVFVPGWVGSLRATHGAVASYVDLLAAVNTGDLDGVRRRCSTRYLASHAIREAKEGGVVGMPRNIHKNFQAWRADRTSCSARRTGSAPSIGSSARVTPGSSTARPACSGPGGRMTEGEPSVGAAATGTPSIDRPGRRGPHSGPDATAPDAGPP